MYLYIFREELETKMPESSWADEIDDHNDVLPAAREEFKGDSKIVTEYTLNEV